MVRPTPALRPEDEISHYRIVGPLGAGGMGEVYLAQDRTLGRNVALKVLPPDLVQSEERVRRFVLEAKSASSLSHPNIVTIHEIGQDTVRSPGQGDSGTVHFISMELVNGKTLSSLIHDEHTPLRTLVGWLAQAAGGIAKAHAAGIVHRDLKPGNIMVTSDGFAKVLDFGLAKLTERSDAGSAATSAATMARDHTGEGAVIGTAGYMSPEQVRGKSVDARSDIFSFGCILYEAATGQRAFEAESSVETMHKVLNETPTPVETINAQVPAELRRLIRRCLQKSPDQRVQSMKDVALQLREIESEFDTLPASASSASAVSAAPAARRASPLPWIVSGVVVVGAFVLTTWAIRNRPLGPESFQKMRMTALTSSGDVAAASLSPDGRWLAYISEHEGKRGLTVRQVATGSDVVVVPPGEAEIKFPSFSPDGNYLYYTAPKPENRDYSVLYQVPSLGGHPSEIAFDVDSRVSFAPDGKQFVFRRHDAAQGRDRLIVHDLGTRKERVLAEVSSPTYLRGAPAWSPDGKQIAALMPETGPTLQSTIAMFDARDGKRRDWAILPLTYPWDLAWVKGGTALAVCDQSLDQSINTQIHLHPYPDGRATRVTNDFSEYGSLSASLSDETVAAVRRSQVGSLYLADVQDRSVRRLTTATGPENSIYRATAADTGTIVCSSPRGGMLQIWAVPTGGGEPRALTGTDAQSFWPLTAAGTIVFARLDSTGIQTWAMDANGGAPRQLTHDRNSQPTDLSADGRYVLVSSQEAGHAMVIATADGRVALKLPNSGGRFSPDSRWAISIEPEQDEHGLTRGRFAVLPIEGGAPTAVLHPPSNAIDGRWTPDGRSLAYIDRSDLHMNVYRLPLSGGGPIQVTHATEGRIESYAWSPDGRRLGLLVRNGEHADVWVADADGRSAVRVTQIAPEVATAFAWMPDSRRIVVEAGTRPSDVVLVRGFR